jgi:hypothetical protein
VFVIGMTDPVKADVTGGDMFLVTGGTKAVRDGANLAPGRAVGRRTWEEFLAERVRR